MQHGRREPRVHHQLKDSQYDVFAQRNLADIGDAIADDDVGIPEDECQDSNGKVCFPVVTVIQGMRLKVHKVHVTWLVQ